MTTEKRFMPLDQIEVRGHSDGRGLQGRCAVYDRPAKLGDFTEVVRRGAFTDSLASGSDILALCNHDMNHVLGRTGAGTLKLSEDSRGLNFEIDELPDTSYANDMLALVRSGSVGGMSFCFSVPSGGDIWQGRSRSLVSVTLHEISCIAGTPAYGSTSISVRSQPDGGAAARLRRLAWVTL